MTRSRDECRGDGDHDRRCRHSLPNETSGVFDADAVGVFDAIPAVLAVFEPAGFGGEVEFVGVDGGGERSHEGP